MDVRAQTTRDGATVAVVLPGVRDLLPLAAANPSRYPCLLESVNGGGKTARHDILFALPQESVELRPGSTETFLDKLDGAWRGARSGERSAMPFHGGWLVFLAYELAAEIEPSLRLHRDSESRLPNALAVRCPAAIVVDRIARTTTLVVERAFASSLDRLRSDLECAAESDGAFAIASVDEDDPVQYLDGAAGFTITCATATRRRISRAIRN